MPDPVAATPAPAPAPAPADSLSMTDSIKVTQAAMDEAIKTNAAITALTIQFQTTMQGINSAREAATEAYKKAGEANNSMHQ